MVFRIIFNYSFINIIRGAITSLIILLAISCNISNTKKTDKFIGWNTICSQQFNLYPIIDSNIVIVSGYCEGSLPCIQGVDLNTGKIKWRYEDSGLKNIFYNSSLYSADNVICIPFNRKTVCIDKSSGLIKWDEFHENEVSMESHLSGCKDKLYRSSLFSNWHRIWQYSLKTGNKKIIAEFPITRGVNSIMRTPKVINEEENILITCNDTYNSKTKLSKGKILKINSDKSIDTLLSRVQLEKANFSPILYKKDQVLLLVNLSTLLMYNIDEDKEIWQIKMPHSILTSRIVIRNDTIYYPCEDEYIYAINAKNGKILWKSQGYGTPSRLAMNNNYIFMTGGNNGILNQYDRSSGKIITKYKFRDYFRKIQRTIAIKDNILVFSDGKFWYARDVNKLETNLLFEKVKK